MLLKLCKPFWNFKIKCHLDYIIKMQTYIVLLKDGKYVNFIILKNNFKKL